MKTVLLVLMALGAFLAAIILAITSKAHADPDMSQDARYLYMLDHFGITNYGGSAAAINGAHQICTWRAAGLSEIDVISKVYDLASLDERRSILLVGVSEEVYCPWYWSGNQSGTSV